MTAPACPLCGGTASSVQAVVDSAVVAQLYRDAGVDLAGELGAARELTLRHCPSCDLRYFDPPQAGSGAFYDRLQQIDWYYQSTKPEFDVALARIPASARVLEVGCGRGAFGQRLQDGTSYVGLELSDRAVEAGRAAGLDVRAELVEAHAESHASSYDVVATFQVLEHVVDVRSFLDACARCLAPGGLLVLSVPAFDGFMGVVANNTFNLPPHHVTWWSDRCLRNTGELLGLDPPDLVHDALAPEHRGVYAQHAVLSAIGLRPRAGRLTRADAVYRLAARALRRPIRRAARRLAHQEPGPVGHSVTALYRVPGASTRSAKSAAKRGQP